MFAPTNPCQFSNPEDRLEGAEKLDNVPGISHDDKKATERAKAS
jgi:hypothetical protein